MANLSPVEAIERLALLNRSDTIKFCVNRSDSGTVYVDGDIDSLVLGDGPIGNVFEWVDDTHKQIKPIGDSDLVVTVKPAADFPVTGVRLDLGGPNSTMIKKLNGLINAMLVPEEGKEVGKSYVDVDGDGHFMEDTPENNAKREALMNFAEALDVARVFSTTSSDDVLEFRMKIKGADAKTVYPIFVNKNNLHVILKYINILKTFGEEFELPNEFYQMILNGSTYEMKNITGTTDRIPEPKKASETVAEYEDRLKTTLGDPGVVEGTTLRNPYAHEKIDYSPTVAASSTISGDNPTVSGEAVDSLATDTPYRSDYYTHMASSRGKKKNSYTYVDDGYGKPVKSEADEKLTTKVRNSLKGLLSFLREHKLACLILGAILVGATVTIASSGLGPMLATLWTIIKYTGLAVAEPAIALFTGAPLTTEGTIIAIMEAIALVYGFYRLHKWRKKKRQENKIPVEEETAQLSAIIEENERNISDAEGVLISINAVLNNPYSTPEEIANARATYDRVTHAIEQSRKQLKKAQTRLRKITPLDVDEEELGFSHPEDIPEGGLSL